MRPWKSDPICVFIMFTHYCNTFLLIGYFDKEIKKEGLTVNTLDINPEAPAPRDMIDLEVRAVPKFVLAWGWELASKIFPECAHKISGPSYISHFEEFMTMPKSWS